MNRSVDIIIIGGGARPTAYYLLKADETLKIAMLEKDPTYTYSSTALCDGNVRIQFNLKENIQISQYGMTCFAAQPPPQHWGGERGGGKRWLLVIRSRM